jgi:hypothetical protein
MSYVQWSAFRQNVQFSFIRFHALNSFRFIYLVLRFKITTFTFTYLLQLLQGCSIFKDLISFSWTTRKLKTSRSNMNALVFIFDVNGNFPQRSEW